MSFLSITRLNFYKISSFFDVTLFTIFNSCFEGPNEQNANADEDPLPNEDASPSENNSHNGQSQNDLVTINVTNEIKQTKAQPWV